jgi:hypothetical protein
MKPQRWTTRPPAGEPMADEDRAGLLLRRAVIARPLDDEALAEIRSRLPDERRAPPRRLVLRLGIALALFLAGGGVVMSATLLGHWAPFHRTPAPAPASPPPPHPRTAGAALAPAVAATSPPAAPAPARTIAPAPSVPRRVRAPHAPDLEPPGPSEPAPARAAPTPSAIAQEAALVGGALRRLREGGDAMGALSLLDQRDARFGVGGKLADEARTARVEALLRLGERERALALLDAAAPLPRGRGRALLATRGELRADAGRCREAVADFDVLLADDAASDDAAERALYQRAACRARLGDSEAASADLETYLERFPMGRDAARARAALDR